MGAFNGFTLTTRGRALQSKAQVGAPLNYTKAIVGDGTLTGQSMVNLTALISPKKTLPITGVRRQAPDKAIVETTLSNQDITTGFYFREIGIFAQDPDIGEILYAYANSGAGAEYIPPGGGPDVIEKNINMIVVVGTATTVTATIDESLVFATKKELDDALAGITIEDASLTKKGVVQLSNDPDSNSTTTAVVPDAVRRAMLRKVDARFPAGVNIIGDGVADDYAGLRGYIDAKIAAGDKYIFIPRGTYRITSNLFFTGVTDVTLFGVGHASTIRGDFRNDQGVIVFRDSERVGLETMRIVGPGGARLSGADGVKFSNCTTFHMDRVTVEDTAAAGVLIAGGSEGRLEKLRVRNTRADGIHVTEGASDVEVTKCRVFGSGDDGIATVSYRRHGAACFGIRFHENYVRNSLSRGITNVGSISVDISHNDIDNTSSCGILVHRDGNVDYDSHIPIDTNVESNKTRRAGRHVATRGSFNAIEIGESVKTKVVNNTMETSLANGLVTQPLASYIFIDGNAAEGNAEAGFKLSGTFISGGHNTARNNGKQGVLAVNLDRTSDAGNFVSVDNNTSNTTSNHGGVDNVFIDGCVDTRFGDIISLSTVTPHLFERAIQVHNSPGIKIASFDINIGTRLVFTGSTANVQTMPFTVTPAPTAANLPGYAVGQAVYFGGDVYRWDGTTWAIMADLADIAAHSADSAKHNYWGGPSSGTGGATAALAYKVTVAGTPDTGALPDGFPVTFTATSANAAAEPMLQVNNTTALPIRRTPTTTFAAGAIKAGQLVSVVKVGNYFLARSAPPVGNATAAQVISGYTFQSEAVPDGGTGTAKADNYGIIDTNISGNLRTEGLSSKLLLTLPAGTRKAVITARVPSQGQTAQLGIMCKPTHCNLRVSDSFNRSVYFPFYSGGQLFGAWAVINIENLFIEVFDAAYVLIMSAGLPADFNKTGPVRLEIVKLSTSTGTTDHDYRLNAVTTYA